MESVATVRLYYPVKKAPDAPPFTYGQRYLSPKELLTDPDDSCIDPVLLGSLALRSPNNSLYVY